MSKIDNGGPAFPISTIDGFTNEGMSLRDWFAGQALMGMGTWMPMYSNAQLANPETLRQRALWAYQQADAMIAETARRKETNNVD